MTVKQIVGWTKDNKKIFARTTMLAREQGAIGQLYRERKEWNAKTRRLDFVMEPVGEHASA